MMPVRKLAGRLASSQAPTPWTSPRLAWPGHPPNGLVAVVALVKGGPGDNIVAAAGGKADEDVLASTAEEGRDVDRARADLLAVHPRSQRIPVEPGDCQHGQFSPHLS